MAFEATTAPDMPSPIPPPNAEGFEQQTAPPDTTQPEGEQTNLDLLRRWADPTQTRNIAEEIDEGILNQIGDRVLRDYKIDDLSRDDWLKKNEVGMKLAMQVTEEKTHPWPSASNVIVPLITVAATQFNARAYPAIVQGRNVVKGVVVGQDNGVPMMDPRTGQPAQNPQTGEIMWREPPGSKRKRATRIGDHMSYQFIEEQTEWESDTDKLLLILPIAGCCFRKTYFAPELGRNVSALVTPKKLVVNYWAKDLETTPRISEDIELYPNQIEEKIRAGLFLDQNYRDLSAQGDDEDKPIEFIEQHRFWDLDEDGYQEPYIVTAHKLTGKIARIVAGFEADGIDADEGSGEVLRIDREHYYTKYTFIPNPDGGFYDLGFGQLLLPINNSVNTAINQLFDAGTLSNLGGGFVGRGFSVHAGSLRRKMGEWTYVNAPGGSIRDAIVPLQSPEPSNVLFLLLGQLIEFGKEIASLKDVLTGDKTAATMQPTTLLALIEQGLKVFTAIFKRVHRAAKREYDKQYRLNSIYLEEQASYQVGDDWKEITRRDYLIGSGVAPASDPTMVSDMQRLAHAQFLQGYQNDPLCNPYEIRKRVFDAAQTADVDKILNPNPPPNPDIVAKAAELELRAQSERVKQIKDLAQAVLYISQADAQQGDHEIKWANTQLSAVKFMVEALTGENAGKVKGIISPPSAPGDGQGAPAPAGGGGGGAQPPIPGARRAPDGQWYTSDPKRPGKYLRVVTDAAAA